MSAVTSNQLSALGWRLLQLSLATVRLPLLWLVLSDKDVHVDLHHVLPTQAPRSTLAKVDPALRGKVGALGTVEAVVEPGMVAKGKRHDEVSGVLSYLVGEKAGKKNEG